MPAWPQLLAFGTSVGFLLVGGVAYFQFARKGGLTLPRKPLLRCCGFSLGIGGLAWAVYHLQVASMDSKGWMVVVCSAVGVGCLLLYVLLMGRWLPTRNVLRKLWRRNRT